MLISCYSSMAQEDMTAQLGFTPYSIFGIGDIYQQGTAYNLSMGGAGIAERNTRYINILNPAAITARDDKSFMMDFGLFNNNSIYTQNKKKSANNITNMRDIVFTMPITKNSAFKVTLAPYSNSGYKFTSHEKDDNIVANIGDITYDHVGSGSIYQVTLGAAYTFFNRLSIGAEGQYYFGNVSRYTSMTFTTATHYKDIEAGKEYVYSAFSFKGGIQYQQPIGDRHELILGATYAMRTNLKGRMVDYSYGSTTLSVDTVYYAVENISGRQIPGEVGVGVSFKEKDKWTVMFDYAFQDWRTSKFDDTPGVNFATAKSQSFRAGFEYVPNRYDIRYYHRRISYRGGMYHKRTYMMLDGKQISATGVTLGVGLPVFRYHNSVNIGTDIGFKGAFDKQSVKEWYFTFNVGINIHDIWFIKPLYN